MAWFEFHQGLYQHPKTLRLARALRVERVAAVGILAGLWDWALDFAQDGDMEDRFDEWVDFLRSPSLDPDEVAEALEQTGWIDRDEHGRRVIHDWVEYGLKNLEKRKKAVKRTQKNRVEKSTLRVTSAQRTHTVRERYAHVMPLHERTGETCEVSTEEHPSRGVSAPADAHARTHEADPYLAAAFGTEAPVPEAPTKAPSVPVEAVKAPQAGTRKPRGAALVPEALRVIWGSLPAKARVEPDKTAKAWRHALTNPHPLNPTPSEPELVAKVLAWAKSEHVAKGFVVPLHAWLAKGRWVEDWEGQPAGGQALANRQGLTQGKSTASPEWGSAVTGAAVEVARQRKAAWEAKRAAQSAIEVEASEVTG